MLVGAVHGFFNHGGGIGPPFQTPPLSHDRGVHCLISPGAQLAQPTKGRVCREVWIGQAGRGRARGGERPMGAASCRQLFTQASCHPPPLRQTGQVIRGLR